MTSDASKSVPDEAGLRGFGPLGILAVLVIVAGNLLVVPLSAILVLAWARWSRTPWREIGYVRPRSWIRSLALGVVFGVAFKFLMKVIVMPLLGADPINRAYHYLSDPARGPRHSSCCSPPPCLDWPITLSKDSPAPNRP